MVDPESYISQWLVKKHLSPCHTHMFIANIPVYVTNMTAVTCKYWSIKAAQKQCITTLKFKKWMRCWNSIRWWGSQHLRRIKKGYRRTFVSNPSTKEKCISSPNTYYTLDTCSTLIRLTRQRLSYFGFSLLDMILNLSFLRCNSLLRRNINR